MAKQKKLEDLTLKDLWAQCKELTGRATQSKDRKALIKTIQDAEAAKKQDASKGRRDQIASASRGRTPRPQGAKQGGRGVEPGPSPRPTDGGLRASDGTPQAPASSTWENGVGPLDGEATGRDEVVTASTAEPASAEVDEALGPALVEQSPDELEQRRDGIGESDGNDAEGRVSDAANDVAGPEGDDGEKVRLGSLTVEALRTMYVEKVGRPTGSSNKAYLMWKIRQVKKGRVAAGAARGQGKKLSRAAKRFADTTTGELQEQYEKKTGLPTESLDREFLIEGILAAAPTNAGPGKKRYGSTKAKQVVPFGLDSRIVRAMDAAWQRIGYPDRISFLRKAAQGELLKHGETEAAAMFDGLPLIDDQGSPTHVE
jgi:hypothetical protein